jgi:hypothetical protein
MKSAELRKAVQTVVRVSQPAQKGLESLVSACSSITPRSPSGPL